MVLRSRIARLLSSKAKKGGISFYIFSDRLIVELPASGTFLNMTDCGNTRAILAVAISLHISAIVTLNR